MAVFNDKSTTMSVASREGCLEGGLYKQICAVGAIKKRVKIRKDLKTRKIKKLLYLKIRQNQKA